MNLIAIAFISVWALADIGPDSPCPKPPPSIAEVSEIKAKNEKPPEPIDPNKIPQWMEKKGRVGDGVNQINREILNRARKYYAAKVKSGEAKNACYVVMDATRPHLVGNAPNVNPDKDIENSTLQPRAFLICESLNLIIPFSSSHGSGEDEFYNVKEKKAADVFNDRTCARYFGNANGSKLTTGGNYLTSDLDPIYKGRPVTADHYCDYTRPFLEFEGEKGTDTANAMPRAIGAHPAVLVKKVDKNGPNCWCADPAKPNSTIYYGQKKTYAEDRSNGCIAMTEVVAEDLLPLFDGHPTTVYIYPESKDIQAINSGDSNTYWNKTCLDKIQKPKFIREGEYSLPPDPPGYKEPPPKPKTMCAPEICDLKPFSNGQATPPAVPLPANSAK